MKKLAVGGMAEVFLGKAEGPGGFSKQVVIKRILPHLADQQEFVQMFLSEARIAAQLSHPNIVQVFDFGQAGRDYFLAMEYVDGPNLRALNRAHRAWQGPLPFAACARLISQACEGLAYAHAFKDPHTGKPLNLVHRDISPDNLIISANGSVKVLDFGIAKAETQAHKTATGMLKGKMAYMPPEQLQRLPLDARTDVYALGVVLFELLAGGLPFDATSEVSIIQAVMKAEPLPLISERVRSVPAELERILARALEKNREGRYPDCKAFQEDLEAFVHATGEKWLPSDLARLVEVAAGDDDEPVTSSHGKDLSTDAAIAATAARQSTTSVEGELDPTQLKKAGDAADAVPLARRETVESPRVAPAVNRTLLAPLTGETVPLEPAAQGAPAPRNPAVRVAVAVATVAAVLALAAVTFKALQPARVSAPVSVPPPPKALTAVVDAGTEPVAVNAAPPELDAGPAPVAPAAPVEPADAGQVAVHSGAKPPRGGKAEVEMRVRPYALVYVDGAPVGQTPLDKPLQLSPGKHTLRMVNEKYGKDVSVDYIAKPGKSVFKYNLLE